MRILLGGYARKRLSPCPFVPHENDEGFQLQTFFVYFYCVLSAPKVTIMCVPRFTSSTKWMPTTLLHGARAAQQILKRMRANL